jgi:hypothetical protein
MQQYSTLHGSSLESIVDRLLEVESDGMLVGYPDRPLVEALVSELDADGPSVRVLIEPDVLGNAFDDFITTSRAADLADGALSVRTETGEGSAIVVGSDRVVVPVEVPGSAAGLTDDDADFVDSVTDAYESSWDDATDYEFDVPPLSDVLESLEDHTGSDLRAAFEAAIEGAGTLGARRDAIDVVSLSLLLGARHGVQLYDLSEWGEETGLASKATFSRTKTQLEDEGLIETESVPIDVGRPRLRLHLAGDDFDDVDDEDFVEAARSRLE